MSSNFQKPDRAKKIRKDVPKRKQVKKTTELQQGIGGNFELPNLPGNPFMNMSSDNTDVDGTVKFKLLTGQSLPGISKGPAELPFHIPKLGQTD